MRPQRPETGDPMARRDFLAAMSALIAASVALPGCDGVRGSRQPRGSGANGRGRTPAQPQVVQPPFHPPIPTVEPVVRVRVHQARGGEPLSIGSADQWLRVTQDHALPHGAAMRGPLSISMDVRGWSVLDGRGYRAPVRGGEAIRIAPIEATDAPSPTLRVGTTGSDGGGAYPGWIELVPRSELAPDAYDVVNHVAIEAYLPGVVARELFNHWHDETHAAQAIAARSFACSEHAYFRARRHFDMTSTQASQAYVGATTHARSHSAVRATWGMVLGYQDVRLGEPGSLLVPAYYSSCCGGRAARAIDAIGPNPMNDIPPLHGNPGPCPCDAAPVFAWTARQPLETLTRRLVVFGEANRNGDLASLVTITSIEAIAHNDHGRPTRYRVTDRRGRVVELPAETLRRAANYAERGLHPPEHLLRSGNFAASIERPARGGAEEVVFRGHGYGHGVGMCQYGAEALARQGRTHAEILRFYYPGAAIVRGYG